MSALSGDDEMASSGRPVTEKSGRGCTHDRKVSCFADEQMRLQYQILSFRCQQDSMSYPDRNLRQAAMAHTAGISRMS